MDAAFEFLEFPKIARLSRGCVITEKIDGTNAQVFIAPVGTAYLAGPPWLATLDGFHIAAGSRNRYLTPDADNFGFAKWVQDHAPALVQLGEGRHFGEWWGSGIQRGYGLTKGEKRFSLFNTGRWADCRDPLGLGRLPDDKQDVAPPCCDVVPVLYRGEFDTLAICQAVDFLRTDGSVAAPGFMKPEGVVIWHEAARQLFKKTIEKDAEPKSRQAHESRRTADAVVANVGGSSE